MDHCADTPCRNGGECINDPDGFTCNCANGFIGPDCSLVDCEETVCPGDACNRSQCDPEIGCFVSPVLCDDENVCTEDSCDAQTGCVFTAITCDDGDACTVDACDPTAGCTTTPACEDSNDCTVDSCAVCPEGSVEYQGSCIGAQLAQVSWSDALDQCAALGGNLVRIDSAEENAAVMNAGARCGSPFFIGHTDADNEGVWTAAGTVASYANWAAGQPDNDGGFEDYALMLPDGTWQDTHSAEMLTCFVCETPAAAACQNAGVAVCDPPVVISDFSAAPEAFTMLEAASVTDGVLRLNGDTTNTRGTAWYGTKVFARDGFTASFTFNMNTSAGDGADGFHFTLQNIGLEVTGAAWGLYTSDRYVSVMFDSYPNGNVGELSARLMRLFRPGSGSTLLTAQDGDWTNSGPHDVVIEYEPGFITVTVDGAAIWSRETLDLGLSQVLDENGYTWVGFAGGTGGVSENHDISAFAFKGVCTAPGCVDHDTGVAGTCAASGSGTPTCVTPSCPGGTCATATVVTPEPFHLFSEELRCDATFDPPVPAWELRWSINGAPVTSNVASGASSSTTTLTTLAAAASVTLQRGDTVACGVRPLDGDWTESAPVAIANTPPVITAVVLEPADLDSSFTCQVAGYDPDANDPLELGYLWRQTLNGVTTTLDAYGQTLEASDIPRDASVRCVAVLRDGEYSAQAESNDAYVLNRAPTTTGFSLTSNHGTPYKGSTYSCVVTAFVDADADLVTGALVWTVNDIVRETTTIVSGQTRTLSGGLAEGDIVTCTVTPSDSYGLPGDVLTSSLTVQNHVPSCNGARFNPNVQSFGANATVACLCNGITDHDGDVTSTTCNWETYGGTPLPTWGNNCTINMATVAAPDGIPFVCKIAPVDVAGTGTPASINARRTNGGPSWAADAARPYITANGPVDAAHPDTELTCNIDDTAVNQPEGYGYTFEFYWSHYTGTGDLQIKKIEGVQPYDNTLRLNEIGGTIKVGGYYTCRADVFDGVGGNIGAASEGYAITDSPIAVTGISLTASGDGGVIREQTIFRGDDLSCAMTLSDADGAPNSRVRIQYRGTGDWLDYASASGTTLTPSVAGQFFLDSKPSPGTDPFAVRCVGEVDSGSGYQVVATTPEMQASFTVATVTTVQVLPPTSTPCEQRVCHIEVEDPATANGDVATVLEVWWFVENDAVDYLKQDVTLSGPTTTFDVPATNIPVADGSQVRCEVRAKKGYSYNGAVRSDASTVSGSAPTVGSVALTQQHRVGDVVTCMPADLNAGCAQNPAPSYTWYVNGVLQAGANEPTFPTDGLEANASLTCAVNLTDGGLGAGVFTVSDPLILRSDVWTIMPSSSNEMLGRGVAVGGDLDGDGWAELLLGAPNAAPDGRVVAGRLYVVRGADEDDSTIGGLQSVALAGAFGTYNADPAAPGGSAPGAHDGTVYGDGLGTSVARLEDVTGDGVDDVVVAAPYALANGAGQTGRIYVLDGAALDGLIGTGETEIDRQAIQVLDGERDTKAGYRVAVGDIIADGMPDLVITAPKWDRAGGTDNGRAYVVSGALQNSGSLARVADPTGGVLQPGITHPEGFAFDGATPLASVFHPFFGRLSVLGDFDGDGLDDFLVAAHNLYPAHYLVLGRTAVEATVLDADDTEAEGVLAVTSGEAWSMSFSPGAHTIDTAQSGRLLFFGIPSGAGDVNGDGLADLVVPSIEREDGAAQVEIAVFFGRPGDDDLEVRDADLGIGGFTVEGRPSEGSVTSGVFAHALGDVDGDGLDDIGVSFVPAAPGADTSTVTGGRFAIIYGRTETTTLSLRDLEYGVGGRSDLLPNLPSDVAAGDVDGDGLSDVLLGYGGFNNTSVRPDGYAEVRFGSDQRSILDARGTEADDVFTGTVAADQMIGGRGNDVLDGQGGADALSGGSGDDVLTSDGAPLRIDGGRGYDVWRITGGALDVDVGALGMRVRGIEEIDLTSASVNLTLSTAAVTHLASIGPRVVVRGDADDLVVGAEGHWSNAGAVVWNGEDGQRYVDGYAELIVLGDPRTLLAPGFGILDLAVDENSPAGTIIGTLDALDPDGVVVSMEVLDGDPVGAFSYDATSRVIRVESPAYLDHEDRETWTLLVAVTDDDGLVSEAELVIAVRDVNEAPRFREDVYSQSITEGPVNGTLVALPYASDPDANETLTFSILAGDPDGAFGIDAATGRLTVVDGPLLDYEQQAQYALTVQVRDAAGLGDTTAVVVTLLDRDAVNASLDLTFVTVADALFQQAPSNFLNFDDSLTQSLETDVPGEEFQLAVPNGVIKMGTHSTGSADVDYDVNIGLGELNAYIPVAVTLSMPDQIPLDAPFTLGSTWYLGDEAVMWGTSPNFNARVNVHLRDGFASTIVEGVDGVFENIELPFVQDNFELPSINFDLDANPFVSRLFRDLYPNGFQDDPCYFWEVDCQMEQLIDDLSAGAYAGAVAGNPNNYIYENFNVWGEGLGKWEDWKDDHTFFKEDNYPNMLMTTVTTDRVFRMVLDPYSVMDELVGIAYWGGSFGPWWASVSMDLPGDIGYVDMRYDLWSCGLAFAVDMYEAYYLNIDGVTLTMTLEDGTVLPDVELGTDTQLTFPASADVNGDGRVSVSYEFKLRQTFHHYLVMIPALSYFGKTLGLVATLYLWEYDAQGNREPKKIRSAGYGPLSESEEVLGMKFISFTDEWSLSGFNDVTGSGRLQVVRDP